MLGLSIRVTTGHLEVLLSLFGLKLGLYNKSVVFALCKAGFWLSFFFGNLHYAKVGFEHYAPGR